MIRQNWFDVKGDETLALDWPLTEDSHVWEIGGFEGRWAQQIWDKFHCNIRIYEPQIWAVAKMKSRFQGIEKIDIRPYGLWTNYGSFPLANYFTDGASMISGGYPIEETSLFINFLDELPYLESHGVNLALMNVEGAEYTLIPKFIESGAMNRIENFWCQFHPGLFDEKTYYPLATIFSMMELTHEMIWDCYPHAVAWRRK